MKARKGLVVVGSGGQGKMVVSVALALGLEVEAVLDDDPDLWGGSVLGIEISGPIERDDCQGCPAVLGIGSNRIRMNLVSRLSFDWLSLIHPEAWVHPSVEMGQGSVVFAGAIVQPDTVIGRHSIVNTGATVDHDCSIGDYCHIAPGVNLAGFVGIGTGVFMGIGSNAIPGVRIGQWTTVGAGSTVLSDLPSNVVGVGSPVRIIRSEGDS